MKRWLTQLGLLAGLALLLPQSAHAGWAVNGDAYVNGNQVVLTPEANDQAGSAWIETQIDISKDFDISFRINLGSNDASGADGISFALHSDSAGTAAFGNTAGGGEWIGMNGICPALSVEVDTYQNGSRGDPAADHVGVNAYTLGGGGSCNGVPNHAGAGPTQADGAANIEDGAEHELRVTWDVSTNTLVTYFNSVQRLTYVNDIENNIFGGNPMVYFGFTASTGGAFNLQYIIPNSAAMDATKASAPDTFLLADLNKQTTYTIDIVNNGIVTAFGTQITDTLPTGFTYVPGSTTGATTVDPVIDNSDPDHQVISWNLSATPIPPNGGTATISFDAAIAPSVGVGTHRNDFEISGDNFVTIDRSQTAVITIGPVDLSIDKSHAGAYTSGNNEVFSLDVANAGPDEANNLVVTDTLPAGLTYVSSTGTGWTADASGAPTITWSRATPVPSGTTLPTISVTVLVDDTAAPGVTNTASVTSDNPDTNTGNDSDSDPIDVYDADLAIDKAHTGDFTVGVDDTFTLDVTSAGPDNASAIVVTDILPAGLTYVGSTGTGWVADVSGAPTIVWTHPGPLASGGSLPTITVTVAVDSAGIPAVDNIASVSSVLPDTNAANDSDTDNIVIDPALADLTIQKIHIGSFTQSVDGDYEIAVGNLGPLPASDIVVTDTLPTGLSYVTSSGTGWTADASGAPTIVWTHPGPLPAGGSLPTISLTVNPGAAAVPSVTNSASVSSTTTGENNPADNSASDPTTVLAATSGNKPLYVRGNTGRELSRDPTVGTNTNVVINGLGASAEWLLAPALAENLTLAAGDHDITLWIHRNNPASARTVDVDLEYQPPSGPRVPLGSDTAAFTIPAGGANTTDFVFTINLAAPTVIPSGSQIVMRVTNSTGTNSNRRIIVHPTRAGAYSMVDLEATTVLEIDTMASFDAAYGGGSATTQVGTGRPIWIRATVSDPFGRDDISGVLFDIFDANGLPIVTGASPSAIHDIDAASRLYEYAYTAEYAPLGDWTARARASEGSEGIVTDSDTLLITVVGPTFNVTKISEAYWDPINLFVRAKNIPGAIVRYTVSVTNQGIGQADSDSFVITDSVPANSEMFLGDVGGVGSGPVELLPGATPCGLNYSFTNLGSSTDDVSFSSNNGSTWTYSPTPIGDYDTNVTDVRINPKGIFLGSSGSTPSCAVRYRVRVD